MSNSDNLDQIRQLADLVKEGTISNEEFEKKKKVLLKEVGPSRLARIQSGGALKGLGVSVVIIIMVFVFLKHGSNQPTAIKVLPRSTNNVSWIKLSTIGTPKGSKPNFRGNDYPWSHFSLTDPNNIYDPWGEQPRQCTSFVAWALYSRNGYSMPFYDNANNWYRDAINHHIPTGNTPMLGSVAVDTRAPYGHVAWVSAVGQGTYTVEEYNYYGTGNYDSRIIKTGSPEFGHFIYFKNLPTQALPTVSQVAQPAGGLTVQPATGTNQIQPASGTNQVQPARGATTLQGSGSTSSTPIQIHQQSPTRTQQQAPTQTQTSAPHQSSPVTTTRASRQPTQAPPTTQAPTYSETAGGVAHTWTNYSNAGGTQGPSIAAYQTVQITCRLNGFKVQDGNTWWYKIASSPWNNSFYVSADAFYNNGHTNGSLQGTPFYDSAVPVC